MYHFSIYTTISLLHFISSSDCTKHASLHKEFRVLDTDWNERIFKFQLARQEIYYLSGKVIKPISDDDFNELTHLERRDLEFNDNLEEVHFSQPDTGSAFTSADETATTNETNSSRTKRQVRLSAITGGNKWPKNVVPYFVDLSTYPDHYHWRVQSVISKGLAYLESISCVKFVERSKLDQATKDRILHNHAVRIYNGAKCWSHSGCTNCKPSNSQKTSHQDVSLATSCLDEEYVQHEFGHVLGLTHEHTRTDMHKHIAVNYSRVSKPEAYYRKTHPEFINNAPYDLSSIQHYQASALVTPNPDDMWLKHGTGKPTHYDEWSINNAYCTAGCEHLKCYNDGYITNRNGRCECICPEGLSGIRCGEITSQRAHSCGKIIVLNDRISRRTITTPRYPHKYRSESNCTWLIKAPEGKIVETRILDMDLPSSWRGCTHHLSIRDRLIGQIAKEKCGSCNQNCFTTTSRSNQVLIHFNADKRASPGRGARIEVSLKDGCGHCRGARCYNGQCYPQNGALSCGFEQGLIGDCSDIKIHDTYQKSYEDISWTEAAWEITKTIPKIEGLSNTLQSAGGRLHLQSRRPPPFTPGPYEGAFRTVPYLIYPGLQRCLKFKLFLCCDRHVTLRVYRAVSGVMDSAPLLTLSQPGTQWKPISLTVNATPGVAVAQEIEMVFIASHSVSSNEGQAHLGIDDIDWRYGECRN